MPPVIGGIVALVGVFGITVTAAAVTKVLVSVAISIVLSGVSRLLAKKPKQAGVVGAIRNEGRNVSIRQPLSPRQIIYGRAGRIGGTITFADVTGGNTVHLVITFTGHQIEGFDALYLDDKPLGWDENGDGIGQFIGKVHVEFNLGTDDQAAFPGLVAAIPSKWTVEHRQRGCAGIYIRMVLDSTTFPSGVPNISADIRGKNDIEDPRAASPPSGYTENPVLCTRDYMQNARWGMGLSDLTFDEVQNMVEANVCDEEVELTGDCETAGSVHVDGDDYIVNGGNATFYDIGDLDEVTYPNPPYLSVGPFQVTFAGPRVVNYGGDLIEVSAESNYWVFVFDPTRMGSTDPGYLVVSTTVARDALLTDTDNIYLGHLDAVTGEFTLGSHISSPPGGGGSPAEPSRGNEVRYHMNGAFTCDTLPKDVIQSMLTAFAGRLVYSGGKIRIHAGAYTSPTVELTESDLRGPIEVVTAVPKSELFNGVRGVYISPESQWAPADFPFYQNPAYVTEDDGEELWRDVELPFTISTAMAQRLAKIELERARRQTQVSLQCKLTAYRVRVLDVIELTLDRYGWVNKTFEVQDVKFAMLRDGDNVTLGVDLVLRATDADVYEWSTDEEKCANIPTASLLYGG